MAIHVYRCQGDYDVTCYWHQRSSCNIEACSANFLVDYKYHKGKDSMTVTRTIGCFHKRVSCIYFLQMTCTFHHLHDTSLPPSSPTPGAYWSPHKRYCSRPPGKRKAYTKLIFVGLNFGGLEITLLIQLYLTYAFHFPNYNVASTIWDVNSSIGLR